MRIFLKFRAERFAYPIIFFVLVVIPLAILPCEPYDPIM